MSTVKDTTTWFELTKEAQSQSIILKGQKDTPSNLTKKISACGIELNYEHQLIDSHVLTKLTKLVDESNLYTAINNLMSGEKVNRSENRPALHTALRAPENIPILVDGKNIMEEIAATKSKIKAISNKIRHQEWLGFSGKPITDIINIGIGGSDLGPRFCMQALKAYRTKKLNFHFISTADPNIFEDTVENLNPETTLFIVSSKSFTTPETLYNAKKALDWIGKPLDYHNHFIAVTANEDKAKKFGIELVLPIWDWVGGRYSFCSAINLISVIAIGYDRFTEILAGAYDMDRHFQSAQPLKNLPIMLALLGIWNNNFLNIHNLLILTYGEELNHFMSYVQQLDMESNGKSVDLGGNFVDVATGPIIWGGPGNQAQHSYYQLLCQGTHSVVADFVLFKSNQLEILNQFAKSKINILTCGTESEANKTSYIAGNASLNHIAIYECSPFHIGALVSLYEHKIFTQSVIWRINAFDQPGVESAKKLFNSKIKENL